MLFEFAECFLLPFLLPSYTILDSLYLFNGVRHQCLQCHYSGPTKPYFSKPIATALFIWLFGGLPTSAGWHQFNNSVTFFLSFLDLFDFSY